MHDQAEDRCHRIGQRDAVTAWYLLAAETIDERMARLIQRKRAAVAAVTDGQRDRADGLVEAVIRELREGTPFGTCAPSADQCPPVSSGAWPGAGPHPQRAPAVRQRTGPQRRRF